MLFRLELCISEDDGNPNISWFYTLYITKFLIIKLIQKPQAVYISEFKQKMTQIWLKRAIFEFSHKMQKGHSFPLQRLGLVHKITKF